MQGLPLSRERRALLRKVMSLLLCGVSKEYYAGQAIVMENLGFVRLFYVSRRLNFKKKRSCKLRLSGDGSEGLNGHYFFYF
jgi:hypothetical protein